MFRIPSRRETLVVAALAARLAMALAVAAHQVQEPVAVVVDQAAELLGQTFSPPSSMDRLVEMVSLAQAERVGSGLAPRAARAERAPGAVAAVLA